MIVIRKIRKGVAEHFDARFSEWVFTVIGLLVGIQLAAHDGVFASNAGYGFMRHLASEGTWATVTFLVSFIRLVALIANGQFAWFRRFSPMARSLCAGLHAGVWFAIGASVYVAAPYALLWVFCLVIMAADIRLSIKIAYSAGQAFEHYRGRDGGA